MNWTSRERLKFAGLKISRMRKDNMCCNLLNLKTVGGDGVKITAFKVPNVMHFVGLHQSMERDEHEDVSLRIEGE